MIRLLHVSDLHLQSEKPSIDQRNIIEALLIDLEPYVNEDTFLIFSGDLIDKSGLGYDEEFYDLRFDYFEELFFEKILKKYPQIKGKIFFIPGNHDLARNELDEFTDFPLRENFISNPKIVDRYIEKNLTGDKMVGGLTTFKKFEKSFSSKYHSSSKYDVTNFHSTYLAEGGGLKIGISCLNSSWLCFDDENREKIFIGARQIENSLETIGEADIKIAIIHHPFEFLHPSDLQELKPLLFNEYDLLFFGHTHKLESSHTDSLDGNLFMSIGKSINGFNEDHKDYTCGYTIVDFYKDDRIEVTYKKYIDKHKKFVINSDIGNDEGKKEFFMPREGELLALQETRTIIDNIISDQIPKLNEDLILNISQSNKSTLEEIFVEPIIGNLPESNLEEQDDLKYFETSELVASTKSSIIFGGKEVGKTVLLDKIFIDLTKKFSTTRRIPILLNFKDIGSKNIKQVIKDFIFKSSKDLERLLNIVEFDLLIDDLDFSKDYKYQLKELQRFIEDYPKTRLVATITNSDDKIVPFEDIDSFSKLSLDFNVYYIHLFKSKQIKGLVSNWITNSDLDVHQNIEKLIKGFRELGLPKTPLAVTIFLWIINKQQNKPINNAVLVEMFVDNLLEKSQLKNIYLDTFDFEDKQRILAHVAKFMLDKNNKNLNYRVKEHELLKMMDEYLQLKIDIRPSTVLNYFLDRGILIKCNGNSIRFKTAFFFSYFLARYMVYDKNFKKKIISKNNYLSFINELDFYTGLNRDDEEVFDFVNKQLLETYSYINEKVRDDYEIIDKILDSKDTISSMIDLQKVKRKPNEKELEEIYDSQMSTVPSKKDIQPKPEIIESTSEEKDNVEEGSSVSSIEYAQTLKLASIVFKNSNDVKPEKRKYSYENLILSSISFMMMYRDSIIYYHESNNENISKVIPKTMNFGFFLKILPIIHQTTMYNWIGSLKSAPIIREKIKRDFELDTISELEKFLSVYIYADIRGKNHPDYITEFFKQSNKRFILDSSFIKNMSYYYLRSKTDESDKRHLKLLSDIKLKLGETSKRKKGSFIQKLKDNKREKSSEN